MPQLPNAADLVSTPTLDEVMRRRADLYQAILWLEQAAARPAAGREDDWAAGVVDALEELEGEIEDHIEITECPDGLYDEIVEEAPRLSGRIASLRAEHPVMLATTVALRRRLEADGPGDVEETRDDVQRLLGRLVKHRQHGADLLWQAYTVDTGGAE